MLSPGLSFNCVSSDIAFFFFFFSPWGRNLYFKPLLEISGCPAEAKLQQHKRDRSAKWTQALPSSASCCSSGLLLTGTSGWAEPPQQQQLEVVFRGKGQKRLLRGRGLEREHYSYQIHGTCGTCLDSQPSYFYTFFLLHWGDTGIRKIKHI